MPLCRAAHGAGLCVVLRPGAGAAMGGDIVQPQYTARHPAPIHSQTPAGKSSGKGLSADTGGPGLDRAPIVGELGCMALPTILHVSRIALPPNPFPRWFPNAWQRLSSGGARCQHDGWTQ